MTELQDLTTQRDGILARIREIETTCEGIENENNAHIVQKLNLEQVQLAAQKNEIQEKLNALQSKLSLINDELVNLSGTGVDRILEAIKNQRWYFFKNKTKVLMDRNTGILWANLQYFSPVPINGNVTFYEIDEAENIVSDLELDGYNGWRIPTSNTLCCALDDDRFPFLIKKGHKIHPNCAAVFISGNEENNSMWVNECYPDLFNRVPQSGGISAFMAIYNAAGNGTGLLPCSKALIEGTEYENNVFPGNPNYTEKERLQFTLELFVQNELLPIFEDDEVTQLYKKIYFDKPVLLEQLQELQPQIDALKTVTLLSSDFDYTALLANYDMKAINCSIIKYYQAVQQWCVELLEKLEHYEQKMESIISDFNLISLKLSKNYEDNPNLTKAENELLSQRQRYFQKSFSLGMYSVKSKILAVKKQADDLEYRIDEIDNSDDAIRQLAVLEKEERASFGLIAENTAKILRNALAKIEYFQSSHQFVMNAIDIWEKWSENYRVFKTTYREDFRTSCEDDSIEEGIWSKWYENWQSIRFAIEQKVQPIIDRGLKSSITTVTETESNVPELLIAALEAYKSSIDRFFLEERKSIYQKFVFQAGGDLQDKFECESELYKCTTSLQSALQEIIFNCADAEDRVFILKWANSLLDIQIDEILSFVADADLQKIPQTILAEFATLKQKNYDVYLSDAKAYGAEKARREKEYNSLIFKMRMDLTKQ